MGLGIDEALRLCIKDHSEPFDMESEAHLAKGISDKVLQCLPSLCTSHCSFKLPLLSRVLYKNSCHMRNIKIYLFTNINIY